MCRSRCDIVYYDYLRKMEIGVYKLIIVGLWGVLGGCGIYLNFNSILLVWVDFKNVYLDKCYVFWWEKKKCFINRKL